SASLCPSISKPSDSSLSSSLALSIVTQAIFVPLENHETCQLPLLISGGQGVQNIIQYTVLNHTTIFFQITLISDEIESSFGWLTSVSDIFAKKIHKNHAITTVISGYQYLPCLIR